MTMPYYGELQAALNAAPSGSTAAEAHGTLCGLLCAGATDIPEAWLHNTLSEVHDYSFGVPGDARDLLEAVHQSTVAALEGDQMGFELLLPDDEAALEDRAAALAAWCNAFLYGLAMRGLRPMEELPDELREILADFSEIGRAGVAAEEAEEVGESAYAELVEYVRVGVQIVFDECRAPRQLETAGRPH